MRAPAVPLFEKLGLIPDPWQATVLETDRERILLNCCRQAGKSSVVAMLALAESIFMPGARILLVSRSQRQSTELFRIVLDFHRRMGHPLLESRNAHELVLKNLSRIVAVPCREDTIRGFSHITLLIIDEAARVPDDLYRAVRPMLAVSGGRLICLSTPYGKRGFFWSAWTSSTEDWLRIEIPATQVPRIPPEFLDEERRALGDAWFRQEYGCSFEAMEGLVYPDFDRCVVASVPANLSGRKVGGIDFGFRNPFAALWGVLDRDDVLWLTGEHYLSGHPLSDHVRHLPRGHEWFADPSGAAEIAELCRANFTIRAARNAVIPGLSAVLTRLNDGSLRILAKSCPNLLRESHLYRYDEGSRLHSESPLGENNHALDALRYLIYTLDAHRLGRRHPLIPAADAPSSPPPTPDEPRRPTDYEMVYDPRYSYLWTHIF
jgi:hypothetical protein